MMIKKEGFCVALVVVLVVISCGPVSNAEDDGRAVINPIFRVAIIETCLLQGRALLEKYRDEVIKVEIHYVGDMIYKVLLIIHQIRNDDGCELLSNDK